MVMEDFLEKLDDLVVIPAVVGKLLQVTADPETTIA
jgi:HD-like signal output (HDOD) protein